MITLYKFSVIKKDKEFYSWAIQNKTIYPFIINEKGKMLMSQNDIELLYRAYCIAVKKTDENTLTNFTNNLQ